MPYIKAVSPMKENHLFVEFTSGSAAMVNLSRAINSIKFCSLKDPLVFKRVSTDGDFIIWGNNDIRITAKELLIMLLEG